MSDDFNLQWGSDMPKPTIEEKPNEIIKEEDKSSALSLDSLSPNEKAAVLNLKDKIDITDGNSVVTYGVEAQNKVATFSDSILKNINTKDSGEAGKLLADLVVEIKSFDGAANEKPGILSIFGGVKKQIDKIGAQYNRVETNIEKITDALDTHKRVLLKDMAMLDEMYENNYKYYKELTLYIIAGKEKLNEINDITIPELRAKAEATKDEIDVQKLNDMVNYANRFEKKLHDLALTRMISIQMAPQIRLLQNNDAQLIDKIQSSIVNSIPLWKNQIIISLGLVNSRAALESQRKVTDMTNELLKKNSEMLKQGSLEIASESERSIVSIDTIRKTNENLIETINGVIDIQKKGREDRQAAEAELMRLENEFKTALLNSKSK